MDSPGGRGDSSAVEDSAYEDPFADYRRLLEKASAKFDEIRARRGSEMACGRGCSMCCAPGLSVFRVESEHIRSWIEAKPGLAARLLALQAANPHGGRRCSFLEEGGGCSIYEARPVICRTHGAPVFFREGESYGIDACPENFTDGLKADDVMHGDAINLDLLNGLLSLVNQRFEAGSVAQSGLAERLGARLELSPSCVLGRVPGGAAR